MTSSALLTSCVLLQVGVQVFTKRPLDEQQNIFNPDDVISCLKKYPRALARYLEHLVVDRNVQVSLPSRSGCGPKHHSGHAESGPGCLLLGWGLRLLRLY